MSVANDLTIERDEANGRGRYSTATGTGTAELTYSRAEGRIVIGHTYVPPSARGRGIAEALVRRAVEDARAEGVLVRPLCSYAASIMRRRADMQDVLDA